MLGPFTIGVFPIATSPTTLGDGSLSVAGGVLTSAISASINGTLATTGNVTIFGTGPNLQYAIENTGTGGRRYFWGVTDNTSSYAAAGTLIIVDDVAAAVRLKISSAGLVTVPGAAIFSSTVGVVGNFAVNTNKFTVAAASGDTLVAGVLTVSGGASITGTLGTTGNVTIFGTNSNLQYAIENTGTGGRRYFWGVTDNTSSYAAAGTLIIVDDVAAAVRIKISSAGLVTIPNLAGVGSRPVVTDANGALSAGTAGPSGGGAAGRSTYWSSATALTSSADYLFTDTTGAGTATELGITNPDNTSASSNTIFRLKGGGASGGQLRITYEEIPSSSYVTIGVDARDGGKWKVVNGQSFVGTVGGLASSLLTVDLAHNAVGIGTHANTPNGNTLLVRNDANSTVNVAIINGGVGANSMAGANISGIANAFIQFDTTVLASYWRMGVKSNASTEFRIAQDSGTNFNSTVLKITSATLLTEFESGNVSVTRSASAANVSMSVINSNNASGTANSLFLQTVGGSSGGDALYTFTVTGVTSWSMGVDNSNSDVFCISESTALGTSDRLRIATGGQVFIIGALDVGGGAFTASTGGNIFCNGTCDVTGNFAVNTTQFTVAAATGNTVVAGTLNIGKGIGISGIVNKSSDYTIALTDWLVRVDTGTGNVNITCPAASGVNNQLCNVNIVAGTGTVTLLRSGSDLIAGATSQVFGGLNESRQLQAVTAGAAWDII